ncbi:hypothetical protein NS228_05320 [Methylobacterium indicum]|uniref:hypothetical protein n=1 Tax=Methylobacterium indicum TaxID=1775910 RepID=UPI000733FDB4|nr:hypothetical protein [Methylobacterium indicum]KTS34215.1 hypothetical protein NS229_11405 [Methylobacterium indicum]KTS41801.1 hypothetical protein NS228_05320 [Methylobacterium indicum]KTS53103.1 hypothetical protein NS230_07655 [Methylobacterium indicum]
MRALLALVAGGPIRVSTSAAALATIAFVATGNGAALAAAAIVAVIWSGAFCLVWGAMAIGAAMAGVLEAPPSPTVDPREADHG